MQNGYQIDISALLSGVNYVMYFQVNLRFFMN
jgi:hypothetical protein